MASVTWVLGRPVTVAVMRPRSQLRNVSLLMRNSHSLPDSSTPLR